MALEIQLRVLNCVSYIAEQILASKLSTGHYAGWQGEHSIRSLIDRIKNQLPDEAWKQRIDTLLPPEAISMLYKRLTGRFRPIGTVVERIISTNDPTKWGSIITIIEAILSSWKDKERRSNIIGELL
ncbi:hypothetical protein BGX21_011050 [Mortierella sp. AD011]|nr:hypothetical protein BGX21_011050 [Mortierella sp. AD011]